MSTSGHPENAGVLPQNVNVLSLEKWSNNHVLLRLENLSETEPVEALPDVQTLFPSIIVKKCQIANLAGIPAGDLPCANTALGPLEIKTFLLS